MSQQEFENYLALLTRLLRIGPRDRDRVAEEFRSHMEDRLDDLLARGVPRDEAVRQALEEFGDAAGLAAELVSLNRSRRNRWIMRLTTASAAAVVLIAAGIITFWPGNNAGPGAAALVAQDPNQANKSADPDKTADPFAPRPFAGPRASGEADKPEVAAAGATLADKLNQRTDVEFVETPLKDAIEFLAEKSELQIILKAKRLEEAGVNLDAPVTLRLKNVRLSTLFDVMLEDLGLVYTEKDDLVVITTPDDAQATMEVRVYDCRDLLTMPTVGMPRPGATIPPLPGSGIPGSSSSGQGSDSPPSLVPGNPRSTPPGIKSDGLADPFAAPRRERTDVLPQAAGLSGVATPGVPGSAPGGMMGGMAGGLGGVQQPPVRPQSPEEEKADELIEIIVTAVNPDSWEDVGGPGTIGEYNGLVVISQSARTHTKIEKVLDMLREAANLPKSNGPRVVR